MANNSISNATHHHTRSQQSRSFSLSNTKPHLNSYCKRTGITGGNRNGSVRYLSTEKQSNDQQIAEDREIFERESSILNSFKSLFATKPKYTTPEGVSIVPTVPIRMTHGLIQKYQFDLLDFITGVKEAYPAIRHAFSVKEKALLTGGEGMNTAAIQDAEELLCGVLHPYFYTLYNCGLGLTKPNANNGAGTSAVSGSPVINVGDSRIIKIDFGLGKSKTPMSDTKPVIESTSMVQTTIGDVDVHLADEEFYADERAAYQKLAEGLSTMIDSSDALTAEEKQRRRKWLESLEVVKLYPEGSVVLSVEAFFLFDDHFSMDVPVKAGKSGDGEKTNTNEMESQSFKRIIGERAFFRSCISGQVPMDWRLTMTEVLHNVTVKV